MCCKFLITLLLNQSILSLVRYFTYKLSYTSGVLLVDTSSCPDRFDFSFRNTIFSSHTYLGDISSVQRAKLNLHLRRINMIA